MSGVLCNIGRRSRLVLATIPGILLCLSSGCGDGSSPAVPVSGHVTVNGQPFTAGHVTFHPNKEKGNNFGGVCVGEINSQGQYTLQSNGKPGAPLGWYKVTVSATEATTADNTKPPTQSLINNTYSLPDLTPLEIQVVDKAPPGVYDVKVGP